MNAALNFVILGGISLALGIYGLIDPDLASLDVMAKALIAGGVIMIVVSMVKFVRAQRDRWM